MNAPLMLLAEDTVFAPRPGASPRFEGAVAAWAKHFQVQAMDCRPVGTEAAAAIWERKSAQVAQWCNDMSLPPEGAHFVADGDSCMLLCQLVLDRPDLVASLTLVDARGLLRGADARTDRRRFMDGGNEYSEAAESAAYQMALERKYYVQRLAAQLDRFGVRRPIQLICADDAADGYAMLDLFDLFARRQVHTHLHMLPDIASCGVSQEFLRVLRTFVEGVEHG
jgi:hypothetical protein